MGHPTVRGVADEFEGQPYGGVPADDSERSEKNGVQAAFEVFG